MGTRTVTAICQWRMQTHTTSRSTHGLPRARARSACLLNTYPRSRTMRSQERRLDTPRWPLRPSRVRSSNSAPITMHHIPHSSNRRGSHRQGSKTHTPHPRNRDTTRLLLLPGEGFPRSCHQSSQTCRRAHTTRNPQHSSSMPCLGTSQGHLKPNSSRS